MKLIFTKIRTNIAVISIAMALFGQVAHAADHTVNAVAVKFEPMFSYVEPGDTITWEGMAGHNVETIDLMSPEGLEKVNSELGATVSLTFTEPGIIVYKCTPHWGARMGGVIVVGKPEDPGAIIEAYLATLETDKSNLPAKGLLKKLRKDMKKKALL